MDPYAAQWAHYGYAIGAAAAPGPDPQAAAAAAAATYPAYYNTGYTAAAHGVQPTPPGTLHAAAVGGNVNNYKQQPRQQRPQTVTHINTNSQPPPPLAGGHGAGGHGAGGQSWQQYNKQPPKAAYIIPSTNYLPTKAFVKASGGPGAGGNAQYDPTNSTMKVHELALHNHMTEVYEKVEGGIMPGTHAVRLRLGAELYTGAGATFKAAKAEAANKCLSETTLAKPVERKTLKARPAGITATQELHELATKKGVPATFKFLEPFNFEFKASMRLWSKEEMRGNYRVQLTVGTMEFMGHADLPQQAKHNAAVQALPYLNQMANINTKAAVKIPPPTTPAANKAATDAAYETPVGKNVIMVLNEIAMTQQVCMDWTMVDEDGPPHMRAFTWTLKMGSYEAVGSGNSKKLAKAIAAQNMYQTIPDEWKNLKSKPPRTNKKPNNKRKKPMPPAPQSEVVTSSNAATFITSTNTTLDSIELPGEKKLKAGGGEGPNTPKAGIEPKIIGSNPIYSVIQTGNPISALFEYCKKVKYPDPVFECVSENVLETWQKNNHTFKKTEYTMKLEVAGKAHYGAANTKKAAKTAVATEAWNIIRAGTM